MNITLSPDQENAIHDIMVFLMDDDPDNSEMVLGGKAGTGKSFLIKYLLEEADQADSTQLLRVICNSQDKLQFILTSTTNKAARVLSSLTGRHVMTIHSLLRLIVYQDYKTGKTRLRRRDDSKIISNQLIIIDEASFANEELLNYIRACTQDCKILYVGDPYQLAPVMSSESPVFTEIKNQVYLTTIQRQAAGSPIIQFADKFREAQDTGEFPHIASHGSAVLHLDAAGFQQAIDAHFSQQNHRDYARIVAWSNARIIQYNNYVRDLQGLSHSYNKNEYVLVNEAIHLNGSVEARTDSIVEVTAVEPVHKYGFDGFKIEIENKLVVFQPKDILAVRKELNRLAKECRAGRENWSTFFQLKNNVADLRPFYANTINKAQGSTYENVFIDLNDIGRNTKNREIARLIYTAITRASNKVYLYGDLPRRLYA